MFLEFSVQNFRSILERQTLSLVATKDKTFQDTHVIKTENTAVPRALRGAGLYGANGSGKSNLLCALGYIQFLVKQSFSFVPDSGTNLVPFALQENAQNSISEFEITVLIDKVRYQYGFRLDRQRILEEWLLVYRSQRGPGQSWFERRLDPVTGKYDFVFSEKLVGAKKVWQDATRSNALFLSTAVQLNSEMLHPLFNWIANGMVLFTRFDEALRLPTCTTLLLADLWFRKRILSFLQESDIAVSDIQLRSDNRVLFLHRAVERDVHFDLSDESQGTQRLFALAGPILEALKQGRLLVVDDFECFLHPLLVGRLLELFHDPTVNTKGAQLVFTTHNTHLLDQSMFRRDQIWLVEKSVQQATHLAPLTEFRIRKDLVLEKAYLEGRFGAIPIFASAGRQI